MDEQVRAVYDIVDRIRLPDGLGDSDAAPTAAEMIAAMTAAVVTPVKEASNRAAVIRRILAVPMPDEQGEADDAGTVAARTGGGGASGSPWPCSSAASWPTTRWTTLAS